MRLKNLATLFKRPRTNSTTSDSSAAPSIYNRIDSVSTWNSYDPKNCHVDETDPQKRLTYLPHTLITSDLGTWGCTSILRFSHFLPEDPSIAVFSEAQGTPVPDEWQRTRSLCPRMLKFRCRLRNGGLQVRSPCTIRVIVGSRWQYKICPSSIRHWSAEKGLLLVDWNGMYDDYFLKDGKRKNKKRAREIVKKFRKLETKALLNETGARWTGYGDWDIETPTAADVALACRYEGQGFENDRVPLSKKMTVRELGVRFRQVTDGLREVIGRRVAKQKWKMRVRLKSMHGCH